MLRLKHMLLVSFVRWWYGAGWFCAWQKVGGRVERVLELFSVKLLLGSLFAPFRQIAAGTVQGAVGVRLRAWSDRQFSRGVGAAVRLVLILCGLVTSVLYAMAGVLICLIWPFVPVLPVVGFVCLVAGI